MPNRDRTHEDFERSISSCSYLCKSQWEKTESNDWPAEGQLGRLRALTIIVWKTRKYRGEFKWNGSSRWKFSGKKVPPFEVSLFSPFLPKRPKCFVPFVWITSARLHVQRKRKLNQYFVNGTTQSRSCFRCQKKYQYHSTEIFHRNFRANGKRSSSIRPQRPGLLLYDCKYMH